MQLMTERDAGSCFRGEDCTQGKYPVEALKMMVHIVRESTEQHLDYKEMLEKAGAT